jgi:excisionase family DNA binding protein
MEDLSNWLTMEEFAERIGKSYRSVERLITLHRLTVAKRPVEGKKPITVIAPDEVKNHKAVVLRPTVTSNGLPAKPTLRQPDMQPILHALERLRMPLSQKIYLTQREAALYLGFPQSEVHRLIVAGTIPTIRLSNGWVRIARKEVEQYTPARPPLAGD